MLQKLTIKNIALISSAEINFTKGLNVLSGETGAGKSVILESINFVLGAKADKSLIRSGETECLVKAEFDVSGYPQIKEVFNEEDIEYDDLLIVSRRFNVEGRSVVKINGETVTVAMLKKFTALLIDVHGQSEHFSLLKNSNQLSLLDKVGGEKINSIKDNIFSIYSKYKGIIKQIDALGGDERQRNIRIDILDYYIKEIEEASIVEGEEENLKELKEKIKNREKILNSFNTARSGIVDEGGVNDVLSNAIRSLSSVISYAEEYNDLFERLSASAVEIEDIASSIESIVDSLSEEEYDADAIEERLDKIKIIKKKYGNSVFEIEKFLKDSKEEKERLENFNDTFAKLLDEKLDLENVLYKDYCLLSRERSTASERFSKSVTKELLELGMPKAKFNICFDELPSKENCKFESANGIDKLEFMFSANLGEPLKPLSSVISGGEMSRFMLSIKAQTAKYNDIGTFIFDEIDSGISGFIAKAVAEKFAKISMDNQIIAISHLPQISAMADNNLFIRKSEEGGKTVTNVKIICGEDKIDEIVRLIGGERNSESARIHAKELIVGANEFKKMLKESGK